MTARGPGRPRDQSIDASILSATVDELIERGFKGVSMESIAARAGVAKTTLYRRWSNDLDLTLAAMASIEQTDAEPPDLSVRDTIVWLADGMRRRWSNPRFAALMRQAMANGSVQPEVFRQARERFLADHLRRMNAALQRGVDEGLISADADLDWVRRLITSPIIATAVTFGEPVTTAQLELSIDIVLAGLRPLR
jgi:AcrR family transcriptional regulator